MVPTRATPCTPTATCGKSDRAGIRTWKLVGQFLHGKQRMDSFSCFLLNLIMLQYTYEASDKCRNFGRAIVGPWLLFLIFNQALIGKSSQAVSSSVTRAFSQAPDWNTYLLPKCAIGPKLNLFQKKNYMILWYRL